MCAHTFVLLQTARQHREEQARLLEENAALKARIAAEAARAAMGGNSHSIDPAAAVRGKTFAAVADGSMGGVMDGWISRLER